MLRIDDSLRPAGMLSALDRMWELSASKLASIEESWDSNHGSPVFTVEGRYESRGWTDWTQGFQFGSSLLQFDATGETAFLDDARGKTRRFMARHITHVGVHDHGFNNVSTYGNLRRLMLEGRIPRDEWELSFYELALKSSGAVQAMRWTDIGNGDGYIYSFNGPHSLFADTIRSLRALALSHSLGHALLGEKDRYISLLDRLLRHARVTADYAVYYGEGRDAYDMRGRVAHESIFNTNDGSYRCPNSQQGYSPFTTWTRGQAWILLGCAEQLEFLSSLPDAEFIPLGGRESAEAPFLKAGLATADFYLDQSPTDGIPYWDTGAPGLHKLGDFADRPADPENPHEPVDSSAAAIAAQGLLRLGRELQKRGRAEGARYWSAGLTVLDALLKEPYLSKNPEHQGLLLHSVYHRPNGWDHVPGGRGVPRGESSMWGDYHLREAALYVGRIAKNQPDYTFFGNGVAEKG